MMIDNSPAASTGDGVLGSRPLVRNTILLILSRGVTLISGLLITAWLGRKLGPENYGIIGFATALLSYYGLVVAAGLDIAGARDIARHGARVRAIASHIFTLRLLLAGLALVGADRLGDICGVP
jgi:O-antigen/teichoic acid export membrane protein